MPEVFEAGVDWKKVANVVIAAKFTPGGEYKIGGVKAQVAPTFIVGALVNPIDFASDPAGAIARATLVVSMSHPFLPRPVIVAASPGTKTYGIGTSLPILPSIVKQTNEYVLPLVANFNSVTVNDNNTVTTGTSSITAGALVEIPFVRNVAQSLAKRLAVTALTTDVAGAAIGGPAGWLVGAADNIPLLLAAGTIDTVRLYTGLLVKGTGTIGTINPEGDIGVTITAGPTGATSKVNVSELVRRAESTNYVQNLVKDVTDKVVNFGEGVLDGFLDAADEKIAPLRNAAYEVIEAIPTFLGVGNLTDPGRVGSFARTFPESIQPYVYQAALKLVALANGGRASAGLPPYTGASLTAFLDFLKSADGLSASEIELRNGWTQGLRNQIDALIEENSSSFVRPAMRSYYLAVLQSRFREEYQKPNSSYANTSADYLRFIRNAYQGYNPNSVNGNQVLDELYNRTLNIYAYNKFSDGFKDVSGNVMLDVNGASRAFLKRDYLTDVYAQAVVDYYKFSKSSGQRPAINELEDFYNFIENFQYSPQVVVAVSESVTATLIRKTIRSDNEYVSAAYTQAINDFYSAERKANRLQTLSSLLDWLVSIGNDPGTNPAGLRALIDNKAGYYLQQYKNSGFNVSNVPALIAAGFISDSESLSEAEFAQALLKLRDVRIGETFNTSLGAVDRNAYLTLLAGSSHSLEVKNALAGAFLASETLQDAFVLARDALLASGKTEAVARSLAYTQLQYRPEIMDAYADGYLQSAGGTPLTAAQDRIFRDIFERIRFAGGTEAQAASLALTYARTGNAFTFEGVKIGSVPTTTELSAIRAQVNRDRLLAQLDEALAVARNSGNPLGELLSSIVRGIVTTENAQKDTIKGNAIAAAMQGLGQSFEGLVRLIGRGDLVAFGAVLGDLGGVISSVNNGIAGDEGGAGLALLGSSLKAVGTLQNKKELILIGSLLKAGGEIFQNIQKTPAGQTPNFSTISLQAISGLTSALAGLTNDEVLKRFLQTASVATSDGYAAIKLLQNDGKGSSGALAAAAAKLVGTLIGGDVGTRIGAAGQVAKSVIDITKNINPASAAIALVQNLAAVAGLKVPNEANYFLGLAATAVNFTNPIGWALFGAQTLFNLFRMGSFTRESLLQDNIDLDADTFFDDRALLQSTYYRNFFGSVKLKDSRIVYEVVGVNPEIPHKVDYKITGGDGREYLAYAPTSGLATLPRDAQGRYVLTGEQYKLQQQYAWNPNEYANPFGLIDPSVIEDLNGYTAVKYVVSEVVVELFPTYSKINPSTGISLPDYDLFLDPPRIIMNPSELAAFRTAIGATSTQTSGTLAFGSAGQKYVERYLQNLKVTFAGAKNDPNLYFYLDMNGDGNPDLIRMGLTTGPDGQRLRVPGDGKVEVTFYGTTLRPIGGSYIADSLNEAIVIGRNYELLMAWGASRPNLWDRGTDAASFYQSIKANETIYTAFRGADSRRVLISNALTGAEPVSDAVLQRYIEQMQDFTRAMGVRFNPQSYVDANPGVAALRNASIYRIFEHYFTTGNAERLAINEAGTIQVKYQPLADNWTDSRALAYAASLNDVAEAVWTDAEAARNYWNTVGRWRGDGPVTAAQIAAKLPATVLATIEASVPLVIGTVNDPNRQEKIDAAVARYWITKGRYTYGGVNYQAEALDGYSVLGASYTGGNSSVGYANVLIAGNALVSANGRYAALITADGVLKIRDLFTRSDLKVLGRGSGINASTYRLQVYSNGNLQWGEADGSAGAQTATKNTGVDRNFTVQISNTGVLELYDAQGSRVLWSSAGASATGTRLAIASANATIAARTLNGTAGNDTLTGLNGNDTLNGLDGDDVLDGAGGANRLNGGNGTDTANYTDSLKAVEVNLELGTVDNGDVLTSIERVIGSSFDDFIVAADEGSSLNGGAGDDRLYGRRGNDSLSGGKGNDILAGGIGSDRYVFVPDFDNDTIVETANVNDTDTVDFVDIKPQDLWFSRDGDDLKILARGYDDTLTIRGWYTNAEALIERFRADGKTLALADVEYLVSTMASYVQSAGLSPQSIPIDQPLASAYLTNAINRVWKAV